MNTTNSKSLVNKNHYSVFEHTHDENEREIPVIAKDVAIKWEYYDAKNHEIIVSEQEHSIILKFIWLRATHYGQEHYINTEVRGSMNVCGQKISGPLPEEKQDRTQSQYRN